MYIEEITNDIFLTVERKDYNVMISGKAFL